MTRLYLFLTLFLLPLLALYGCSGSSSGLSTSTGSTGTDGGSVAKTGTLVVSAKFPQNGQKGEIGTALIDQNTARIEVYVYAGENYYPLELILTPSNPTGRIANIPVGPVDIYIYTYDSARNMLDYLNAKGEIVEGQNNLTATLIRGSWQFVDGSGNATTITLNKTLSSDTTTLSSFSVIPYPYYYSSMKKASIDLSKPFGESEYNLLWKGSGFDLGLCGATETCWDGVSYFNQFIGPSTTNNAVESDSLPLPPTPDYTPTPDDPTNRSAFIIGIQPSGDFNSSDPDIFNYFNSRVTGANTMEGTILEILTKSRTGTETCYDMSGNQITCPWAGSASKAKKALNKAIVKAMSQRMGKSAANAQGCFIDLQVSGTDEWEDCADLDGDGNWCECYDLDNDGIWCEEGERSPDDWFKVVEQWQWQGDACGHPFKAVGSQLPTTDLNLVIQKKK
jgi:hypothetical protein